MLSAARKSPVQSIEARIKSVDKPITALITAPIQSSAPEASESAAAKGKKKVKPPKTNASQPSLKGLVPANKAATKTRPG